MTTDAAMSAGPCRHLAEASQRCALGRDFPRECGGCPSYADADAERTRCEVWTRVMGYHRPVSAFNPGKRQEHAERRLFIECPGDLEAKGGHG